jgi:hypothetical protein
MDTSRSLTLMALTSVTTMNGLLHRVRLYRYLERVKPSKITKKPTASEEIEIYFSARAQNCLYEFLGIDIFNRMFTLKIVNEI